MFKKTILTLAVLILFCSELQAVDREIPLFFAYQGSLIDEGGNLLPDGKTEIKFKILDSLGNVLYEETQNLDIVKGEIAAIVGNGLDVSTGSPMGGIPMEALEPTGTRYLQLEASGYLPYDKLEIVTAPYAIWADTALKMPEGSITSVMLGKGIITKDHLNEELMSAVYPDGIPKNMLPADTYYGSVMKGPTGAGMVGVTPSFYNSGSGTVQGVLKDLDFAILKGMESVKYIETKGKLSNTTLTTPVINSPAITGLTMVNGKNLDSVLVPVGTIVPFYDFGGKFTFDNFYWQYCDGRTYNFGGTVGELTLPDLSGRYLVGYGTEDGKDLGDPSKAPWDAGAVGNISHRVNLEHSHANTASTTTTTTVPAHYHGKGSLEIVVDDSSKHIHELGNGALGATGPYLNKGAFHLAASGEISVGGGPFPYNDILTAESGPHKHANSSFQGSVGATSGANGDAAFSATSVSTTTMSNAIAGESSQSIQPRSVRVRYIMRVR